MSSRIVSSVARSAGCKDKIFPFTALSFVVSNSAQERIGRGKLGFFSVFFLSVSIEK